MTGLYAALIRAFPPTPATARMGAFATGSSGVAMGVGLIVIATAVAAFWGLFGHAIVTTDWALLEVLIQIIAVVAVVGGVVAVVSSLYRKLT